LLESQKLLQEEKSNNGLSLLLKTVWALFSRLNIIHKKKIFVAIKPLVKAIDQQKIANAHEQHEEAYNTQCLLAFKPIVWLW